MTFDATGVGERQTVSAVLDAATAKLAAAGIASARLDARLLLQHATRNRQEDIIRKFHEPLEDSQVAHFQVLLGRRASRVPVSQIVGEREFWSLRFEVTGDTLTPRPDSETVVEAALETLDRAGARSRGITILDLGAGSGCLGLALLHELPGARGVFVDLNPGALEVARRNARSLRLGPRAAFFLADWHRPEAAAMAAVERAGPFDLVVCNPPYLRDREFERIEPEVACHEPRIALSGGADGLASYRAIIGLLPRLLKADGRAIFEIGAGQSRDVEAVSEAGGMAISGRWRDLAGIDRCIGVKNHCIEAKNRPEIGRGNKRPYGRRL